MNKRKAFNLIKRACEGNSKMMREFNELVRSFEVPPTVYRMIELINEKEDPREHSGTDLLEVFSNITGKTFSSDETYEALKNEARSFINKKDKYAKSMIPYDPDADRFVARVMSEGKTIEGVSFATTDGRKVVYFDKSYSETGDPTVFVQIT